MSSRLHDLRVYQASRKFLRLAAALCKKIPRGDGELSDQLKRSALSIKSNIAEGSAKFGAEQRRYYGIARASTVESISHVDSAEDLGHIPVEMAAEATAVLDSIAGMLTVMIFGRRGPSPEQGAGSK